MNAIFKVFYDDKYGRDKFDSLDSSPANDKTVAAADVEDAIRKVRKEAMQYEIEAYDKEGEPVPGKMRSCTGIRVHHVEFISLVELL